MYCREEFFSVLFRVLILILHWNAFSLGYYFCLENSVFFSNAYCYYNNLTSVTRTKCKTLNHVFPFRDNLSTSREICVRCCGRKNKFIKIANLFSFPFSQISEILQSAGFEIPNNYNFTFPSFYEIAMWSTSGNLGL